MITLITLILVWYIISINRILNKTVKIGASFNPLCGSLIDFFGFIIGTATFLMLIINICTTYLP